MSAPNSSTPVISSPVLHAPLATLIIGVTGNTDPQGYDATVLEPEKMEKPIQEIYLRVWQLLDWVFGCETKSPLGFPSTALKAYGNRVEFPDLCLQKSDPRLKNKCEFLSGRLTEFNAGWKPLCIEHTPVVLLSSIAPGIDTIVAEVFLDYQRANPDRSVFVRVPLPFPADILERCSSYNKQEDKERLRSLLVRLRSQPGWEESRDLFCVKIDRDWEPIRVESQKGTIACDAEQSATVALSPEEDLKSEMHYKGKQMPRRYLRYRAAGEYIASLSHLLLAIYDHEFDDESNQEESFRKPLDPFTAGTWAIVEAKRRGLSWELLATSNNFSWADNGPVLRLGIDRKKRLTLSQTESGKQEASNNHPTRKVPGPSEHAWVFLHPYDLEPQEEHAHSQQTSSSGQTQEEQEKARQEEERKALMKDSLWKAKGDFVFRRIVDLQETFNQEAKSKWKSSNQADAGELELVSMVVPSSMAKSSADKRTKLQTLLGDEWKELKSLSQAASVRRCAGDLANKVYEPKRFRVLLSLILLVFIAALCIGMFEHWHRSKPEKPDHSIHWNPAETFVAFFYYLPAGSSGDDSTEIWIRAGLLIVSITALALSGLWFILYSRKRIEEKRYDYRALAEALRVQIYWSVAGLNRSVAHDYMQRQKVELDWIRYVAYESSFPLERWPAFFKRLSNLQQNALLGYVKEMWIGGQITNATKKCIDLSHKLHLTHVLCWGLAWAGLLQLPLMLVSQISPDFREWLGANHWSIMKLAFAVSFVGLLVLLAFAIDLALHTIKRLKPLHRGWVKKALHWVDDHFGEHEESVAEPDLARKIVAKLVHYWQLAGVALFVGALALELSYHTPKLSESFPDQGNSWIINTSACLLAGALMLAWQERRFYSEEYRNYCTMRILYVAAKRRLDSILMELESPENQSNHSWTRQRLVAEAQDIFYQVGCEALNENAEWVILHRARPLEPFMAG
jgi:hypothetical protein